MRKLLAALLAASAVALLVVGLAAATPAPARRRRARPLRMPPRREQSRSPSPAIRASSIRSRRRAAGAQQVAEFSYDTLVHQLPGGKIVSGLATKWKVLSQTKARFTLRSGVTCSDGTKLTASVVKKNLDYVANKANGSPPQHLRSAGNQRRSPTTRSGR